jgi:hypothetical protein
MHMLYFVNDIPGALNYMIDLLKSGGVLFITLADSEASFTGRSLHHYARMSSHRMAERVLIRQRAESGAFGLDRKVSDQQEITSQLRRALRRADIVGTGCLQDTRLYGNDIGDLIALGFLTGLAELDGRPVEAKIMAMRHLLEMRHDYVGLALELEGPRIGMWSVSEPQAVVQITKQ